MVGTGCGSWAGAHLLSDGPHRGWVCALCQGGCHQAPTGQRAEEGSRWASPCPRAPGRPQLGGHHVVDVETTGPLHTGHRHCCCLWAWHVLRHTSLQSHVWLERPPPQRTTSARVSCLGGNPTLLRRWMQREKAESRAGGARGDPRARGGGQAGARDQGPGHRPRPGVPMPRAGKQGGREASSPRFREVSSLELPWPVWLLPPAPGPRPVMCNLTTNPDGWRKLLSVSFSPKLNRLGPGAGEAAHFCLAVHLLRLGRRRDLPMRISYCWAHGAWPGAEHALTLWAAP